MRGGCRAGRIQNWILAKMWFRHIYGREDFGSSMQWQSPTHIRITWVGWRRWWRFRPRELWLGSDQESAEMRPVVTKARELGVRVIQHQAGEDCEFGGAVVRILAPDAQDEGERKR